MDVQTILLLVLSSAIVSLVLIQFKNIKKNKDQVLVFLVVLVVHILMFILWNKLYSNNDITYTQTREEEAKIEHELQVKLEKEMEDRATETKKLEFTNDKILPIKTYNPYDCTNDNSCIIPASEANLYGFHEKKGINHLLQYNSKENTPSTCVRCNRPLTLYNNPDTEIFEPTCKCNYCTRQVKEISINRNMCIYCKTAYLQNHQCYSPSNLPNALYLE